MAVRKVRATDRARIAQIINQTYARIDSQYPGALHPDISRNWTAQTVAGLAVYLPTSWVTTNNDTGVVEGVCVAGVENRTLQDDVTTEAWYVIKILAAQNNPGGIQNWYSKVMYRLLKAALPDAKNNLGCVGGATELPIGVLDLFDEVKTFSGFRSRITDTGSRLSWVRFSQTLAELNARDSG